MANEKMKFMLKEIVEKNDTAKLNTLLIRLEESEELKREFIDLLKYDAKRAYYILINAEVCGDILKEIKKNFKSSKMYSNIIKSLFHYDRNVKKFFLKELGKAKSEIFIDIFVRMLREKEWEIRRDIAEILSHHNDDATIMLLVSMLDDFDRRIVKEVVIFLSEKGEKILLYLEKYMNMPMERVKINILELLNKIGTSGALKYVIKMCGDESERVRMEAQNLALFILERHSPEEDPEGYNTVFHFLKKEIEKLDIQHASTIIKVILKFKEQGAKAIIEDMTDKWYAAEEYKKILFEIKSEDKIYLVEEMIVNSKEEIRKKGIELLQSIDAKHLIEDKIVSIIIEYISTNKFKKSEKENKMITSYLVKSKLFESIAKKINSTSVKERKTAVIIISMVSEDSKLYEVIVNLLKDPDKEVRYEALRALEKTGKPEYLKYFEEMLSDPDENIQIEALRTISGFEGNASKDIIMKSMNHPNNRLKEEAAKLIAKDSLKKYIDSFDTLNETNKKRVGMLIEKLDEKTEEILYEEINSTDINTRRRVIEVLRYIKDKYKFKEVMKKAMQDPDKNIRSGVIKFIVNLSDRELLVGLLKLLNDPDKRVRANTIEAFGNIEGEKKDVPIEILQQFLKDEDNRIRANAIMALVNIGHREAIDELNEMFVSSSDLMRASAVYAAGELKLKEKINFIEKLTDDSSIMVRKNIIIYFNKIGEEEKINKFLNDSNIGVVEIAKKYYNGRS